jgi:hypothetical protein
MSLLVDYASGVGKALLPFFWTSLMPAAMRVKITSPLHGATVDDREVIVKGTFRWSDFGQRLILFHQVENEVYPQGSAILDKPHKAWWRRVRIGDEPGKEYTIVIAIVGDEAFPAVQYYSHTGKHRNAWYPIPLYAMPKGYISLASVTVKLAGRVEQSP